MKLKKQLNTLLNFVGDYLEDLLIILGVILVSTGLFVLGLVIGFIGTGLILIVAGAYLAYNHPEKDKRR
ncbi:hypothetical protein H7S74_30240 [Priestia aryabhattai]|uniref:hypothetical protein n=1 Tax=Priestia aryabhattai TaxID=412384 RepID=UPI001ED30860|nr:hypothetical protein [Priestia aryabhattai]MBY0094937.1 hypothetical protein [Priestia aryabhattai]MBY0105575.1 hypothetical protein [Priestia aryabhattai]